MGLKVSSVYHDHSLLWTLLDALLKYLQARPLSQIPAMLGIFGQWSLFHNATPSGIPASGPLPASFFFFLVKLKFIHYPSQ